MKDPGLDPKQLAAVRLAARRQRISLIRKRTAALAVALLSAFTALIVASDGLVPGLGSWQEAPASSPVQALAKAPSYYEIEDDDDDYEQEAAQPSAPSGSFYSSEPSAPIQSSQS